MSSLSFSLLLNNPTPTPGITITLDIFASEPLIAPPTVKMDDVRFATFQSTLGPQSWRFTYTVTIDDTGTVYVKGQAVSDGLFSTSIINGAFLVKFSGDPDSPFGLYPFGYTFFGAGFALPSGAIPPIIEEVIEGTYGFTVRRGQEGPQIVTAWTNPDGLNVKLLRKLLDYPLSDTDSDAEVVFSGTGENYADVWVVDGQVYYYGLFVEVNPDIKPGVFDSVGRGQALAIDNQPFVDFIEQISVLDWVVDVPGSPTSGDRYIVPSGATGAWAGQDGNIATSGSPWTFETPQDRWLVEVTNKNIFVTYRLGKWVQSIPKRRVWLYDLLPPEEKKSDSLSAMVPLIPSVSSVLDGERFNFDLDPTIPRTTGIRFLKNFDLMLNESKGLMDSASSINELQKTNLDLLLGMASLVGYTDFNVLPNPVQRFLSQNISSLWPFVGSTETIESGVKKWVGTGPTSRLDSSVERLFLANESNAPFLTPTVITVDNEVVLFDSGPGSGQATLSQFPLVGSDGLTFSDLTEDILILVNGSVVIPSAVDPLTGDITVPPITDVEDHSGDTGSVLTLSNSVATGTTPIVEIGEFEVRILSGLSGSTTGGTLLITLADDVIPVSISAGSSIADVVSAITGTSFPGWTVTSSAAGQVEFTSDIPLDLSTASFVVDLNTTDITFTSFVQTNAGSLIFASIVLVSGVSVTIVEVLDGVQALIPAEKVTVTYERLVSEASGDVTTVDYFLADPASPVTEGPLYDTPNDTIHFAPSFVWASTEHSRGMKIWFDKPFDPLTFLVQSTALSATTITEPGSPTDKDRYIVPAGATGANWAGQDNKVAEFDGVGSVWIFTEPQDRWAVTVSDTGKTHVFRGVFGTGSWAEAIAVDALLRLEWWLREYVIPDSVFFRFRETPSLV